MSNKDIKDQEILDRAPAGATHVSDCGGNFYKLVSENARQSLQELFVWCGLSKHWLRPKKVRGLRSLKDVKLIAKLRTG